MTDAPQDGVTYPVVIGGTFWDGDEDNYHTLQYSFKPASVDRSKEGLLRKNEGKGLEVEFANKSNETVYFKGQYAPCKEVECILIFDSKDNTFRLERLAGRALNLKDQRRSDKAKPTFRQDLSQDFESAEVHTPPVSSSTPMGRPRSNSAKAKLEVIHTTPVSTTPVPTGSSPEDGASDGATAGKGRKRRAPKATPTAKRGKKAEAPAPVVPKENQLVEDFNPETIENGGNLKLSDSTADLMALVGQIESVVEPTESAPAQPANDQEDFLAFELAEPTPSQPVPPPALPLNFTAPSQPALNPPGQTNFPAPGQHNGAPKAHGAKGDESGSSESESESDSESESESESASDSSSASESENE